MLIYCIQDIFICSVIKQNLKVEKNKLDEIDNKLQLFFSLSIKTIKKCCISFLITNIDIESCVCRFLHHGFIWFYYWSRFHQVFVIIITKEERMSTICKF